MSETREARRAAIIAAALNEFAECGYEGARIESIARRAGIGKSTVYEYFTSKLEIAEAAADQIIAIISEQVTAVFTAEISLRQSFAAFLRLMFHMLHNMGGHILMMQGEAPVSALVRRCAGQAHDLILEQAGNAVRRAQERGEIDPEVSPDTAALLLLMLPSPQMLLLGMGNQNEACIEEIVELLFHGLDRKEHC